MALVDLWQGSVDKNNYPYEVLLIQSLINKTHRQFLHHNIVLSHMDSVRRLTGQPVSRVAEAVYNSIQHSKEQSVPNMSEDELRSRLHRYSSVSKEGMEHDDQMLVHAYEDFVQTAKKGNNTKQTLNGSHYPDEVLRIASFIAETYEKHVQDKTVLSHMDSVRRLTGQPVSDVAEAVYKSIKESGGKAAREMSEAEVLSRCARYESVSREYREQDSLLLFQRFMAAQDKDTQKPGFGYKQYNGAEGGYGLGVKQFRDFERLCENRQNKRHFG